MGCRGYLGSNWPALVNAEEEQIIAWLALLMLRVKIGSEAWFFLSPEWRPHGWYLLQRNPDLKAFGFQVT